MFFLVSVVCLESLPIVLNLILWLRKSFYVFNNFTPCSPIVRELEMPRIISGMPSIGFSYKSSCKINVGVSSSQGWVRNFVSTA